MQTDNRVFDAMARFFTDAAGAAQAFGAEVETMIKGRVERFISEMDFVPRDEFEAVKAMAAKARAENDALAKRIAALEAELSNASSTTRAATGAGASNVNGPKL